MRSWTIARTTSYKDFLYNGGRQIVSKQASAISPHLINKVNNYLLTGKGFWKHINETPSCYYRGLNSGLKCITSSILN